MDDNEAESVASLLRLAKLAIVAMIVVGGYAQQDALLGLL